MVGGMGQRLIGVDQVVDGIASSILWELVDKMVGGMGAASYRSVSSGRWHGEQHLIEVDQVEGGMGQHLIKVDQVIGAWQAESNRSGSGGRWHMASSILGYRS